MSKWDLKKNMAVLHLETEIYLIESQQKCFINPSGKWLIQSTMPPRTSEKMCHLVTVTWWFWRGCSRIVIDLLCFDHHVFGGRPIYVTTPTSWSCIKQECSLHKIVGKPHVECHIISLASWLINDRGIEKADFFFHLILTLTFFKCQLE